VSSERRRNPPRCALIALCLASLASCKSHDEIPLDPSFPPVQIDEAASELVVENATNAEEMKRIMSEAMRETLEWSNLEGRPRRARFKGRAKVYANTNWILGLLSVVPGSMIGASLWLPVGTIEVDFAMELDVEGTRYRGRGVAEFDQFSQGGASDQWFDRAASLAAKKALADAVSTGPSR